MSVQQKGFICLPLKDGLYILALVSFNSTVSVIAAIIVTFDVNGCGEENPLPHRVTL